MDNSGCTEDNISQRLGYWGCKEDNMSQSVDHWGSKEDTISQRLVIEIVRKIHITETGLLRL